MDDLYDVLFKEKEEGQKGQFITKEGHVIFIGGPSSGGGGSGGFSKTTINTTELRKGDVVVGFGKTISDVSLSRNEFGGNVVKAVFEDGSSWETSGNFDTTVFRESD